GILEASRGSSAQVGAADIYLMPALSAVVIGQTVGGAQKPNAFGTMIGALLVATLENGLTIMAVPFYVLPAVKGAVLVLALVAAYATREKSFA
ncbi:MAG: ABC transporter permease, partial [Fastidiosipila sp.]|nr:ABC transporter permease [Fastidiosipila sp.]